METIERNLNPVELRVLGSLIEKEITTPEYSPLTLNATVAACNQKNNRNPVMALSAGQVQEALDSLRRERLVVQEISMEARVPKYRQSWTAVAGLEAEERAVLAELILRGAQTLGELRGRRSLPPEATWSIVGHSCREWPGRRPPGEIRPDRRTIGADFAGLRDD